MEAILKQYVSREDSYLELIFNEFVTPWYQGIGPRGAKIYTRVSEEIRLLKEKKKNKIQKEKQTPQVRSINVFYNSFDTHHITCIHVHVFGQQ